MQRLKKFLFTALLFTLLMAVPGWSNAQCAMCRVSVENNVSNGESSIGSGLNKGILFLLSAPYVAFAAIAYFWYRNSRKEYEKRFKMAGYSRSKMSPM